ncbi:E-selectin [Liparis tanakae]|uniref:E-selectin n=1 Tax=Liparis tanakae TaxID=230148 RepID=A0A4Z2E2D2_9TELE|nr:E-selectin [Liparis tanakae]
MTVHCPPERLNWTEARRYCQENYRDLVTLDLVNSADVAQALKTARVGQAWIGLHRDPEDDRVWKWINLTWKWISGDTSEYRNWAPREPITKDCGTFDLDNSKWHSHVCSEERRFACFDDNVVVVTENKTWEDALSHCRGMQSQCENRLNTCRYRYELLSLERPSDYSYVRSRLFKAETDEV